MANTSKRLETKAARDLIQGLQTGSPTERRVYDALMAMVGSIEKLGDQVFPILEQVSRTTAASMTAAPTPTNFEYSFLPYYVRFHWDYMDGASQYELREGTDWDTADFITRTVSNQAEIDPITIGTHTFLLKGISSGGIYSVDPAQVVITVSQHGAPSLTILVIDNNVLLNYTVPVMSFAIDHFNIYRNGLKVGENTGTFSALFETIAGDYTYGVSAVDVAGNEGLTASQTVHVNHPPDFELQDSRTSDLSGTKTNCILDGTKLLANIDTGETWQTHFTSRGWASPQDQVDAGFPYYMQPGHAGLVGTYVETFDYGLILNNVICNVNWSYEDIVPGHTFTITVGMEVKDNIGDAWSALVTGPSQFYAHFRYLRLTLTLTADSTAALLYLWALRIVLDVKREVDSGEILTDLTAGGTQVNFNKTFKDVDSITLTVKSQYPVTAIYQFDDVPNPTHFHVLTFDGAGQRIAFLVSWKARGIV